MNNCRKCRSMFVEAIYGELTSDQQERFNCHLESCPKCAEEFGRMKLSTEIMDKRVRSEPEAHYWESYWDNLAERMKQEENQVSKLFTWWQRFKENFYFEPRLTYRLAGAVALLVIGIFIGKLYFAGGSSTDFQPGITEQNLKISAEQTAVKVRADRYIARSKVLLLGMINFDPETEDAYALNLPYQKKISQNLVQEAVVLKNELNDPAHEKLRELVADLEVILLQIANLESELDMDGIEMVKSGVDRRGILLKINLEEMQNVNQQRTNIDKI